MSTRTITPARLHLGRVLTAGFGILILFHIVAFAAYLFTLYRLAYC